LTYTSRTSFWAVIGTPDERLGERVSAFVVDEETITADNVESHCRERNDPRCSLRE
jgi:acyl-CoA synthetase (AMP-forming)/AMP-acid ligase II